MWSRLKTQHPSFNVNVREHHRPINQTVNAIGKFLENMNDIRNNHGFSHPNEDIIEEEEAKLRINLARVLLSYIDSKTNDNKRKTGANASVIWRRIMLNKPFNEISLEDISALKTNGVDEGKFIDYKSEIYLDQSSQRKEFAADITSFANTSGGDLLIGISEEQGLIKEFPGIEVLDKDKLLQRIESILRDIVEPQITGVNMNFYSTGDQNKYILHIKVPQSYVWPSCC